MTATIEIRGIVVTVSEQRGGVVVHFARQEDSADLAQVTAQSDSFDVVRYGDTGGVCGRVR